MFPWLAPLLPAMPPLLSDGLRVRAAVARESLPLLLRASLLSILMVAAAGSSQASPSSLASPLPSFLPPPGWGLGDASFARLSLLSWPALPW